jgi:sodium pump decarboxylase gamma subunit
MNKLLEGLVVTVLCMTIVFLVLASITLVIRIQRFLTEKIGPRKGREKKAEGSEAITAIETPAPKAEDDELIAVITAAVAASLGRPVSGVAVRSIRRIGTAASAWSMAGRQEHINSRY